MKDQRSYGTSSRLKRKGNEPVFPAKRPPPPPPPPRRPTVTGSTMKKGNEMKKKKTMMTSSEKKVLAGFMAYEFIKRGTVLGHKFDNNELNKGNKSSININNNNNNNNNNSCYKEITSLLMNNNNNNNNNNEDVDDKNKQDEEKGVCWIPGVVNPSQLANWISGK